MNLFTLGLARIRAELSHKCEDPTAPKEAQLRGSRRIQTKPCSHCWVSSDLASKNPSRAQCEKAQYARSAETHYVKFVPA